MALSVKKEISMFSKAQGSALLATFCDYSMRIFVDKIIDFDYLQATFFGALTGGIVNCIINYRYVFSDNDARKRDVAWKYLMIWTGSIVFNTAGTGFFKEFMGIKAYYSMLLTSALVAMCWNYMMQRTFVFKGKKHKIKY